MGFIGTNIAKRLAKSNNIFIIDDLSRNGVQHNKKFLAQSFKSIQFFKTDVSDYRKLLNTIKKISKPDIIFHLAAQVAVTTSIINPMHDFNVNVKGTVNLLECVRNLNIKPIIVYSSTNKVYGALEHLKNREDKKRYTLLSPKKGLSEKEQINFYTPYGCSKGAADQYVSDYCRIYGIPSIVFRQSCIYGEHQFGVEDQGWLAWIISAALLNKKIKIFGTGKQVRDILYVNDLIDAYISAIKNINLSAGQVFNVGGGYENSVSLLEFIEILKSKFKINVDYTFDKWRSGDQLVFISDNSKLNATLGWKPETSKDSGIAKLVNWLKLNKK